MEIKPNTVAAQKLFHQGVLALSKASINGMRVDVNYCKKQKKYLTKKIKILKSKFFKSEVGKLWRKNYTNPNINSDQQLRHILFEKMNVAAAKTTKPSKTFPDGQPSVDGESLEIISEEVPALKYLVDYKKMDKVSNTYIDGILKEQVDGFLHPFFHLDRARTFRSSSSNINFQNQPNRDKQQRKIVRSAFVPRPGNLLMPADFKGIEVGVGACYHKDPKMIKYVSDPKSDMHGDMAVQCYMLDKFEKSGTEKILRKGAKNGFVFPQFYGDYYGNNVPVLCTWAHLPIEGSFHKNQGLELMTGETIGSHFIKKGIRNINDFLDHIQEVERHFWNNRFKKYNNWKKNNVKSYYKKGHLNTLTGFTCSGLMSKNDINNYPIQGAAFHCLLKTFIEVDKRLEKYNLESKLIGQIHDELVLDVKPSEKDDILEIIRDVACIWLPKKWGWIIVPMEVEVNVFEPDANWAQSSTEVKLSA